jgi:hypothetical protein
LAKKMIFIPVAASENNLGKFIVYFERSCQFYKTFLCVNDTAII